MKGEITVDSIREQLPSYLTSGDKERLVEALSRFPVGSEYYVLGKPDGEMWQGDGWTKLQVLRFINGDRKSVLGMVLSNTCDIAPENPRDLPTSIVFAPMIPLTRYCDALEKASMSRAAIASKVDAIKKQNVTTIFYLPAAQGIFGEDHIVLLDDIHTMPSSIFEKDVDKTRSFRLSLVGFYLLIFKLSIHFCRLRENVPRSV